MRITISSLVGTVVSILCFVLNALEITPMDYSIDNGFDFATGEYVTSKDGLFSEFHIDNDIVKIRLKDSGVRFRISRNNEIADAEYGQFLTLKAGERLTLTDGRHSGYELAYLRKKQLNEEQRWLCDKVGFPGGNVLAFMEYFNSKSFGENKIQIRRFLILPDWNALETSAFRLLFLNCQRNRARKYVILSARRPDSLLNDVPMNTNTYEDVLLRLKDRLKEVLEKYPLTIPPTDVHGIRLCPPLLDRPDENVWMAHHFEAKELFSIEVTPTTGFRSNIEKHISGVTDRNMFIYTKFDFAINPVLKRKIEQILKPSVLLINLKADSHEEKIN